MISDSVGYASPKQVLLKYLPNLTGSPNIAEYMTVITALIGLNVDTITGPLLFIAHALKLTEAPLIRPAC